MPWHLRCACSQANRPGQHQPAGRPQVSEADCDSQKLTRHLNPVVLACPLKPLPLRMVCDRRLLYQIFICLLCSVQILHTGKMHYVWISARAASDKENWTIWIERQIVLFLGIDMLSVCISVTLEWERCFEFWCSGFKIMHIYANDLE